MGEHSQFWFKILIRPSPENKQTNIAKNFLTRLKFDKPYGFDLTHTPDKNWCLQSFKFPKIKYFKVLTMPFTQKLTEDRLSI